MKRNGMKRLIGLNALKIMIIYKLPEEKEALLRYTQLLDDSTSLEILQRGFVKDKQEAIHFAEFFWRVVAESARMQENSNPNRKKYDLISNSCNHFMKGVLDAAGVDTPYMFDPRPNSYIAEIRLDYPKLDYSRAEHKLVVENPPASLASIIRVYAQPAAA